MVCVVICLDPQPLHQVEGANDRIGKYDMAEKLLVVRGVELPIRGVFVSQC